MGAGRVTTDDDQIRSDALEALARWNTQKKAEAASNGNGLRVVPDIQPDPQEPPDEPDPGPSEWKGSSDKRRREEDAKPRLWNANDLAPSAQPSWLATNRLPRAAISLLIGDEGIGKSLLWVLVVAHVTTGRALPAFGIPTRNPGRVMLVITEDDWSTCVRPRLELAGADLSMVQVICTDKDGSGAPIFPRDMSLIRNADPKPDLVVVDCWLDTVPNGMNVGQPQDARKALHPWKDLATTTDAAMWLLAHSNRVATGNVRDRYGLTYVLRQKARMTIWAMQDEDGDLLAGPEKANGARTTVATGFTIKPVQVNPPTDEDDGTVPLLECTGLSDRTIGEHVKEAAAAQQAEADAAKAAPDGNALSWLAVELGSGPRWSVDVATAAEVDGIKERGFNAAKRKLGVKSSRQSGNGPWFMYLPQHEGLLPGGQIDTRRPGLLQRQSGQSGETQNDVSTSQDSTMTAESTLETPAGPESGPEMSGEGDE